MHAIRIVVTAGNSGIAKRKKRYRKVFVALCVALCLFALISLSIGHYSYDPRDVVRSIYEMATGRTPTDPAMDMVLLNIRIPRVAAAMLVGAALSLSGAVYQGVFKNPLVSPDLLGVSSGACVGAAAAVLLGLGMVQQQALAFVFGLVAVTISVTIPKLIRNNTNLMLVLAGIITSGFMSSVLGVMKFVADEETELSAIVFWQMGSLTTVDGIERLAEQSYARISGGERQQVSIARVLVQKPAFILLDEPTSHLDFGNQIRVLRLVRTLTEEGFGILMTTHNPDHVLMLGGKVVAMERGGAYQFGDVADIVTAETLRTLYGVGIALEHSNSANRSVCVAID